jgi:hypothetical protein
MEQEYFTKYPKTVAFHDGVKRTISIDAKGVEQLTVIVKKNVDDLLNLFKNEGFTHVKFEHKQESQIGHGLSLKLKKPWEMHVRLVDMKKGLVAIHAEVEVSRDYLQHLFCQRTPVIYEIESMLKKHQIDYKIWNDKVKNYVHTIFDNYKIRLATPSIPVFAWKPMLFFIGTISIFYLWKYLNTI